jgi:hypothetical protein
MGARYVVRLMFEWGGGCLWCGNDPALDAFGVGPIEERLSLSPGVRERLAKLSQWHDGALNREDPPDPSPWSGEERVRFERDAVELLAAVRAELGPEFEVVYVPLESSWSVLSRRAY